MSHPTNYEFIIGLINTLSLGFFGIGLTVFTIMYAFIVDKREKVSHLLEIMKKRELSVFEERELNYSKALGIKYKQLSNRVREHILISFLLFLFTTYTLIFVDIGKNYMIISLLIFGVLLLYTIRILFTLYTRFKKDTL